MRQFLEDLLWGLVPSAIALVWYTTSVLASILSWQQPYRWMDHEYVTMTVYYTPLQIVFFPTLLTYFIVGEPSAGYFEDMILQHTVSLPIYLAVSYVIFLVAISMWPVILKYFAKLKLR